jgi:uncharacterized protein (DUF488 family)
MSAVIWTIGHSTRTIDAFIELLRRHGIQLLADVRAFPSSKRNPQFNKDRLAAHLGTLGLEYHHIQALGGRRRPRPDSPNMGWQNSAFRGYADYMQTDHFERGLEQLIALAGRSPSAVMCAEAVPRRCHRSLIADALMARGWTVLEIVNEQPPRLHALPSWARVMNGKLTYPGTGNPRGFRRSPEEGG